MKEKLNSVAFACPDAFDFTFTLYILLAVRPVSVSELVVVSMVAGLLSEFHPFANKSALLSEGVVSVAQEIVTQEEERFEMR